MRSLCFCRPPRSSSKSYGSAEEYLTLNPLKEPACVLLDNQLPGMSGIELLRRIVAATGQSAVIMITAYGDVPTAVLAMKAGAFHFVQKPFDAEALLATVEEALSLSDDGRDAPHEMKEFKARQALLTRREREVLALLLEGLWRRWKPCWWRHGAGWRAPGRPSSSWHPTRPHRRWSWPADSVSTTSRVEPDLARRPRALVARVNGEAN